MNESEMSNSSWDWYRETIRPWVEDPGDDDEFGLNLTSLKIDEAFVVGAADRNVGVYAVSDDCFRCPFELQKELRADAEESWIIHTARRFTWRIYTDTHEKYISARNTTGLQCQLRPEVGEFGIYRLNINNTECKLDTVKEPVDIYMPLLLMLGLLTGVWILYGLGSLIMSRLRRTGKLRYGDKELAIQQRLRALDTFRG